MSETVHVDAAAPQAEFTQLRKPDVASEYWSTSVFKGSPITFRVLDETEMTAVDGTAYLNARLQEMYEAVRNASIHHAAELAYRSVFVEVSTLDDPLALPSAADCAVDLWLPLHVALMTGNKSAVQTLLQFHVEHAVDAMTCFANTPSKVSALTEARLTDSPVLTNLGDEEPVSEDAVAAAAPATHDPILECQVRRELGGTVVLLGHFDGRVRHSSSAAVRRSRAPSPTRFTSGSATTPQFGFAAVPTPPTINNSNSNSEANNATTPLAGSAEDLLVLNVSKYNDELLEEEMSLFEDRGEEYCLMNVLTALRPLLQSVVLEIERRWQGALPGNSKRNGLESRSSTAANLALPTVPENAIDLLRHFCISLSSLPQHPSLLVGGDVLFELCHHGDLATLTKVMDAFEGTLAPVLRGQTLLTDRQNGVGAAGTVAGLASSAPHAMATASRDPSPHLSSLNPASVAVLNASSSSPAHRSLGRNHSSHSVAANSRASSVGRHLHLSTPTSFWWSCRPQQVHHLAFIAHWIGCREVVEESSGSGRRRRAVAISTENRVMMATIRQLIESRVAAQKLSSMIWSGHLVTITKLLSQDCTLEDFMDFVEEGGYLTVVPPSGFSGLFLSVLVSGVAAATAVRNAAMMRVLRRKVETLLADVPGRPSPLRAFVMCKALTHAERFRELWLDAGSYRDGGDADPSMGGGDDGAESSLSANGVAGSSARLPHKFHTRLELLYYAVVEEVLVAAEEAWTQEPEDAQSGEAGAAPTSLWVSGSTKQEAQAALQSWLLMWTNFFTGLRDRTDHRRSLSLSYSSVSSQAAKESQQPSSSMDGPLSRERNTPCLGPVAAPPPPPATSREESNDDLLAEDTNEGADTIRRVCRALADRLERGSEPLPTLRRALFPNGAADVDNGVSGSTTPAHVDKALPISSIDQEFTSAARAFGDTAAKESHEVQLKFYGLYKQATKGDVNISRPGFFDYAGKAKWDAWAKLKGMSLLDAKRAYVSEYKMMIDLRKAKK